MSQRTLADIPKDYPLFVVLLHVDMTGHSVLMARYKTGFEQVRLDFRSYAEGRVFRAGGVLFSWEGDGGTFVFWGEGDAVAGAMAALSVLSDMLLFNLQCNPFPEFVDIKLGVHRGIVTPREDPGNWAGEDLNFAGKFFKDPNGIRTGIISVTEPVFNSLNVRSRERFHWTRKFQDVSIYEFGRELLDPSIQLFVRYISANRIIDITNPEGDSVIKHYVTFVNPHPSRDLDALSLHIGSLDSEMEWKDCEVRAWESNSDQMLAVEPTDIDDPHIKTWRARFPALRPGSPPYALAYSCRWNRMFPRLKDKWESKFPGPIEVSETRVIYPPGMRPIVGSIQLSRYIDPGAVEYLSGPFTVTDKNASESKRWEVAITLTRPRPYYTHRLEWQLQDD